MLKTVKNIRKLYNAKLLFVSSDEKINEVIGNEFDDYFKELKLTAAKPTIKLRTSLLGAKSFEIEYLITSFDKENNEVIHAKGKSVQVLIDTTLGKSIEIPDWLREAIMDYEPAL